MNHNLEIEYKILVNQKQFDLICALYPNAVFKRQMNVYYDTIHNDLRKNHCAMRIRDKGDEHLFTLKAPGEKDGKMEFEKLLSENSCNALKDEEIIKTLSSYIDCFDFVEIGRLVTYRASIDLEFAELCLDVNIYNDQIDYEIEYEWKQDHDGLTKFNEILSNIGLTFTSNCKSKVARCLNS